MPDWKKHLRERLPPLRLAPERELEIIEELAQYLEDCYEELRAGGATVVDVNAADIDAQYRAARNAEPGALAAAWQAYLSRGAAAGDRVITLRELLASGKLAPVSARRFEIALAPTPTGDELRQARAEFIASREAFRDFFVRLMDAQRLDALLYPANQARPHTHEGGLERFGGEPGTCQESAYTGLPQVTVASSATAAIRSASRSSAARGPTRACSLSPTRTSRRRITANRRRWRRRRQRPQDREMSDLQVRLQHGGVAAR
jgi:hypothetical protein